MPDALDALAEGGSPIVDGEVEVEAPSPRPDGHGFRCAVDRYQLGPPVHPSVLSIDIDGDESPWLTGAQADVFGPGEPFISPINRVRPGPALSQGAFAPEGDGGPAAGSEVRGRGDGEALLRGKPWCWSGHGI